MKAAVIALITAIAASLPAAPARAAETPPGDCLADQEQAAIDYLGEQPGGTVVAPGLLTYDEGDTIIEIWPDSCGADFGLRQVCGGGYLCFWDDRQHNTIIAQFRGTGHWITLPVTTGFNFAFNNRDRIVTVKKTSGTLCLKPRREFGDPNRKTMNWRKAYLSATRTTCS